MWILPENAIYVNELFLFVGVVLVSIGFVMIADMPIGNVATRL